MSQKRLRVFAGPNGSGKSTFVQRIQEDKLFNLGFYINADDIERALKKTRQLDIPSHGIKISTKQIQTYFKRSTFAPVKLKDSGLWKHFSIENDKLRVSDDLKIDSYIAADLAEFFRRQLLKAGKSFSFETVMSDKKKISFLRKAKNEGYRIYLYFFATEDPLININRVKVRVAQDGHPVDELKIRERYSKSLKNLIPAIKLSDRAYLFDNSNFSQLIAEITDGEKGKIIVEEAMIPNWIKNALS